MVQFNPTSFFAMLALLIVSISSSPLPLITTSDLYERDDVNELLQARGPGGIVGAWNFGRKALEFGSKTSDSLTDKVRKLGVFSGRIGGFGGGGGGGSASDWQVNSRPKFRIGLAGGRNPGRDTGRRFGNYVASAIPY